MSGLALSTYCGLLNEYYDFLATGNYDLADDLNDDMDAHWEDLTEEERDQARQHAHQLAERYMS